MNASNAPPNKFQLLLKGEHVFQAATSTDCFQMKDRETGEASLTG